VSKRKDAVVKFAPFDGQLDSTRG